MSPHRLYLFILFSWVCRDIVQFGRLPYVVGIEPHVSGHQLFRVAHGVGNEPHVRVGSNFLDLLKVLIWRAPHGWVLCFVIYFQDVQGRKLDL
jgi:hypothetical protein